MTSKTCSVNGCTCNEKLVRGYCPMHYQRWKFNGDPLVVKRRAKQAETCEQSGCDSPGYARGLCLSHYREYQKSLRGTCIVPDCSNKWQAQKMCTKHYTRFKRTGSTDDPPPTIRSCSVEDCQEQVRAHDLCGKHYRNLRKYGTVNAPPKQAQICVDDSCTEIATRRGMCQRHYRQVHKELKPEHCPVQDCRKTVVARGKFCEQHGGKTVSLFRRYNITWEQYDLMMKSQDGRCAICKTPADSFTKGLSVDHDHACCPGKDSCGKCVRSLLCIKCNRGIGMFNDNPELLLAAIDYLRKHQSS